MLKSDSMLVAYVDGELDPATAQKVEALLATDARASERVRVFRETAAMLRAQHQFEFLRATGLWPFGNQGAEDNTEKPPPSE